MAKPNKQIKDEIMRSMKPVFDAAAESAKVAAGMVVDPTLEDMKKYHETVDVKISKKDSQKGRYEHFLTLIGQKTADLDSVGLDEMCKDQGMGGEYKVFIKPPDVKSWSKAQMFGPINVSGPGHKIAKLEREQQGMLPAVPGANNPLGYMGGMLPQFGGQKANNIPDLLNYVKSQNDSATLQAQQGNNQMMYMMQQSADKQAQMQMQMTQIIAAAMSGNKESQGSQRENEEMRAMREQMRRMEDQKRIDDQRRADEQVAALTRKIDENKNSMLLETLKAAALNKDDGKDTILAAMLTNMQTSATSQNNNYMGLLKDAMQKPSEDERMSNVLNSAMNMSQQQMSLWSTAMQSGLLNQGNEMSPVAQAVLGIIEGATQVGMKAFEKGGSEEEYEEVERHAAQAMPAPQPTAEALPEWSGEAPLQGLPEGQPEGQPKVIDAVAETIAPPPPIAQLEEADLERVQRDTALAQVLAALGNGLPVGEATARLYAHATSSNDIAQKWLQYPHIIGHQILKYYELIHKSDELTKNIVEFTELVNTHAQNEDLVTLVNEWSKTDYRPIKLQKPPIPQNLATMAQDAPDFGMKQEAPVVGEEYDSSRPPGGVSAIQLAPEERKSEPLVVIESESAAPPPTDPEPTVKLATGTSEPEPAEELPIAEEVPAPAPEPAVEVTPSE